MPVKIKRRKKAKLILINDSTNTFNHVVEVLHSYIPFINKLRAEQIAIITHNVGECEIYHGSLSDLAVLYTELRSCGLSIQLRA